jgi:hypothetical protein
MTADYLPEAPRSVAVTPYTSARPSAVTVSWTAVPNPTPGTAVTGYVVILDGSGSSLSKLLPPGVTSTDFENLPADTVVTATVYAINSAAVFNDAEWLRTTGSTRTIGAPIVSAPTAAADTNGSGDITIDWAPASPNGAPGVTYSIGRTSGNAGAPACVAGGAKPAQISSDGLTGTTWVDSSANDGTNYTYFLYADNGYYCSSVASGSVANLLPPGTASAGFSLVSNDAEGHRDIKISNLDVASGTAQRFQYSVDGGAWADVPASGFITSPATAQLYGLSHSVSVRGCRDASTESLCGPASAPGPALTPLSVRAAVPACTAGAPATFGEPVNAPSSGQVVSYEVAWDVGGNGQPTFNHTVDEVLPADIVRVLVRATVSVPTAVWTDPLYGAGTCG